VSGSGEIFRGDCLADLRRVDDGAFENAIVMQDGGYGIDIA
jgi:hypothetical protein